MKISELPEPYRTLAESRRRVYGHSSKGDSVHSILWSRTPEGDRFWCAVHLAESSDQLPDFPTATDLLAACKWLVAQLQGDSGTGHSHWEQFPEYRAALAAIAKAKGGQS